MLKGILVGLDGSPYSSVGVDLAIAWGRRFDALLVGLAIVDEPAIRRPEITPIGADAFKHQTDEAQMVQATRQVEQILEQFSIRCADAGVAAKVLEDVGEPAEQILLEAQRYDLIMLGQQTYFHFATQESPCETLDKVLRQSARPVVVIPRQLPSGTAALVAFDGSMQAARALQAFHGSGLDRIYELHVLAIAADHTSAARHADRAIEYLALHGVKACAHPVSSNDAPAAVILDHIKRLDACLAVMGAYGQPYLKELFLGSVTRTLLQQCPVPLFVYH